MSSPITVALAGNPNSGKTSVFNGLTGARQHVGNYPGVTVEKKEGLCRHDGREIHVVDLPGTYSLTAYSIEELVARNFIVNQKPDVVVDIIDSSNLERNLYLAVQLMELKAPLVLAFNMSDVAKARGMKFDLDLLARLLGAPIVLTVGHKGIGRKELLDAIVRMADNPGSIAQPHIHYGKEIEQELERIRQIIAAGTPLADKYDARWLALKLLENDGDIQEKIGCGEATAAAARSAAHLATVVGDSPEVLIADRRYGFISGACQEAVRSTAEARHTASDKIDAVLTNRVLGLPIFLALMYLVFYVTFTFGAPPMDWIDGMFSRLGDWITGLWPRGSDSDLMSLLVDGIIGGVGGVLVFLPNILLLFLAIAVLEDTGYMARAAFLTDRVMHKIGLHGKSFIPMLTGFGCSVPAIMATRTLDTRRDRMVTMLVVPLMSCGARLPIYLLIIPAFFPQAWRAPLVWCIYITGIALAIVCAKLLRSTLFRGAAQPFVMELPPYRLPTLRGLLIHMWQRGWLYLKKAGTIILGMSVILWAMTTFPRKTQFDRNYDEEAAGARAAFLASVGDLNSQLNLPKGSAVIAKAVEAEFDAAAEQENYWEHQQGFAEAEEKKDASIKELTKGAGGETLAAFLDIRRAVETARANFDQAVEKGQAEEGTPEYAALVETRDAALGQARKTNPRVYGAVFQYLDQVKAPFVRTVREMNRAQQAEELAYSTAGKIGRGMEGAIKPLGFDWKIGTALIGAFGAKEIFVAQLGIVYSVGEADEKSDALRDRLRENYTPLQGICIMLFCLISAPCMATIAITKKESNSWGWAMFQLAGLTALAYVVTLGVFQVGSLLV